MVPKTHQYEVDVTRTGNTGTGASGYREYERAYDVSALGKPVIPGSADPAFRGVPERWNPEELLVASLSQCHQASAWDTPPFTAERKRRMRRAC